MKREGGASGGGKNGLIKKPIVKEGDRVAQLVLERVCLPCPITVCVIWSLLT